MKATNCRMCQSKNLKQWLDLGLHPHSDHFHKEKEAEMFYPLGVSICEDCGLNQLTYIVAKEELYLKDYLYESSITKTADEHWKEFAETVNEKIVTFGRVIDVGGNDGTLLMKFKALGFEVLNVDPTPEATQIAIDRGVLTRQEFFGQSVYPKASLIVGANVFAHIDDIDTFIERVKDTLESNGVFVFESPYFGEFLKGLEFDTVYHQHLSYLSLKPVVKFMEKHSMEVFDVEQHELHGGGFRVYIAPKGEREVKSSVNAMLANETWTMDTLEEFAHKTRKIRDDLVALMERIRGEGKTVAIVSTPAKGNTLLNYTGIGRYIDFATDKSKLKQGRFLPGTGIEVFSDDELAKRQPDYVLVLAWNFFDEIVSNVARAGYKGKFIHPLEAKVREVFLSVTK
ncbi:MAG: class I SAM-dependent methyltransferase [Candidatus Moranbacteria bacterium]|nr:class I SAM-dependent methyltransferase [Candidatus Moranbacteria bacterium]